VNRDRLSVSLAASLAAALLTSVPLAQAADGLPAKQLAGPPAEFALMRAPDPAAAAIHSKSALLPVEFSADKRGGLSWQGSLPIETGNTRFLVFGGEQGGWSVDLTDPQGRQQKAAAVARHTRPTRFGIEQLNYPAELYQIEGVASGHWTLSLRAEPGAGRQGFVLIEGDPSTELASYQTHARQLVGEQIGLTALLTAGKGNEPVKLGLDAGRIDTAMLRVTLPDGQIRTYPMFDDGLHGDGKAGDGVYGGTFPAELSGQYLAQVVVHGRNADGAPLVRTAEHLIPIVERSISLAATKSASADAVDGRFAIRLPVVTSKSSRHYRAFGEIWGRDAKGRELPVAWVGGMVDSSNGNSLRLGLDERWVQLADARGPFELRNLRIEDPDHFVTVAAAEHLALPLPAVQSKRDAGQITIDEAMTMGPRPADLDLQKSSGSRLLLVHGYCSGGVWPSSHFSNASTFLDVNQSRSHDEFARLIRSFGSSWNSFGVVGHSQGGAASLHLYTYYWSGLDKATGNRLIQSVGTPYQGTNLAGILASMGSWFGVGCGNNANLTYSGASAWLSGIPSWARSKVHYYTTSFSTVWWRWDYCSMATDIVLSDPEDGVTERVNGQLSGANNRGHTIGQCHTTNMRDPAQYHDGSRNSIMNSNAAR
jgi:hypothetical protein